MASESVAWTLKRMAESPLLSAEQELVLGRYTQRLGVFEMVRNGLRSSLEREPTLLEWATATNYTGGGNSVEFEINRFQNDLALGRRAKEQLVNSNMRLVVSIARRYQSLGVSLQDLIQEGSLGLIRAAEK
jgi:DNA-directed RNA polymerase sigma subunit (sigma70/sigma32)